MRVTISSMDGSTVAGPLDVPDEMELENFLALCQTEIPSLAQIPVRQLGLFHSGRMINDYSKSLKDCGVVDGDLVMVSLAQLPAQRRQQQPQASSGGNPFAMDFSSIQVPSGGGGGNRRSTPRGQAQASGGRPDPNVLRESILADPSMLAQLRERNPAMAEALNNPAEFARIVNEQLGARHDAALRRMRMLQENPFDPEVQRMIEQEIQQQEIESHMETTMEHMPEMFAMVTMLYIRCKVNGHEIKAFVDSGAQATIMSESCAKRCNITRFIDRRFAGIARGVGTSKILGRIHMAQLQIENDFLPTSFNVLEDSGVDMLFGLDMLKRHQCIIDLQKNVLFIGSTNTSTEFLPESELPEGRSPGPTSPGADDRHLAEALERSAAETEAASLSAAVAASNVRRSASSPAPPSVQGGNGDVTHPVGQSVASASTSAPSSASNESVDRLVSMGFKREDAIRELEKSGGNVDRAAMALFASSLSQPSPKK